jgi:hypothetical protein
MSPRRLRNLAGLAVLFLTGCGDTPQSIFRSALNGKNEYIDALMKVVDEASAKKFDEETTKQYRDRLTDLKDKLEKWAGSQSWSWVTWDPDNPKRAEDSAAKAKPEYRAAIKEAVEETKEYVRQEEKNRSRIKHEVKRLSDRVSQLENEGASCPKLSKLASEQYHAALKIGGAPSAQVGGKGKFGK